MFLLFGAAPNKSVKVEHLYSCIHFCGIAAGSSETTDVVDFFSPVET